MYDVYRQHPLPVIVLRQHWKFASLDFKAHCTRIQALNIRYAWYLARSCVVSSRPAQLFLDIFIENQVFGVYYSYHYLLRPEYWWQCQYLSYRPSFCFDLHKRRKIVLKWFENFLINRALLTWLNCTKQLHAIQEVFAIFKISRSFGFVLRNPILPNIVLLWFGRNLTDSA